MSGIVCLCLLTLAVVLLFARAAWPRRALAPRDALALLRQDLSAGRNLQARHPKACRVLSDWSFEVVPLPPSRADLATQTIYMYMRPSAGDRFDDETLLRVLLHEVAHATSGEEGHGPSMHQEEAALLEAAELDGVLEPGGEVCSTYPATIL